MNKRILLLAVFVVNMCCASLVCAEQQVYFVQSTQAKILSTPSFSSPQVAEVKMGQRLTLLDNQGNWLKVALDGKEGFISALLVATHPPLGKTGFIKANDSEIKHGVRRRSSSFESAAAARGLTKEDRKRADSDEVANYKSLQNMEALSLSDNEVTKFMEERQP